MLRVFHTSPPRLIKCNKYRRHTVIMLDNCTYCSQNLEFSRPVLSVLSSSIATVAIQSSC